MDKSQADAVAQAMLQPNITAEEVIQGKKIVASRRLAEQRFVARLGLLGCTLGATVAYFAGLRFALGIICGGVASLIAGWVFIFLHRALTIRSSGRLW